MAENPHDAEHKVEQTVQARMEKLKEGRFKYDLQRAAELAEAFDNMTEVLRALKEAQDQLALQKPEERSQAEERLKEEIKEALTALGEKLQTHENYSTDLIDSTRGELQALLAIAQKGPKAYPKPRFFGLFGGASQFEQWKKDLDRNPGAVLDALVGVSRNASDTIRIEAQTENAKRAGAEVRPNTPPNVIAGYLSSNATEEDLRRIEEQQ